jgi:hypothetical protein
MFGFFMKKRTNRPETPKKAKEAPEISPNSSSDGIPKTSGRSKRGRSYSTDSTSVSPKSSEVMEFNVLRKQTGVFRVNCMDCLDR